MKPSLTPIAAASALLGLAAWLLAGWGADIAFNVFPLQVAAAVLAVALANWSWRLPAGAGSTRLILRGLGIAGMALGLLWLLGIGLLYLIWPH